MAKLLVQLLSFLDIPKQYSSFFCVAPGPAGTWLPSTIAINIYFLSIYSCRNCATGFVWMISSIFPVTLCGP